MTGLKCPECGSTGPFRIFGHADIIVEADGTETEGPVLYDGESYCECQACEEEATLHYFTEEAP
jgi:hypothetical protein